MRASKSPKPGARLQLAAGATAEVQQRAGGLYVLDFSTDILPFLDEHGDVPLPPYLARDADNEDVERYQTVYARDPGAVAAPTAGLHFDQQMLDETRDAGVSHAFVTLHVGAGTFQSLRDEDIERNRLHAERVQVSEACCEAVRNARQAGGRVIAIGTTSVRALESASANGEIEPFDRRPICSSCPATVSEASMQ